ncbi:MAG: YraN family protein [Nocardioidaceae bacterium]|nr:YraN family protein [Nocardioidaceae bacterium]
MTATHAQRKALGDFGERLAAQHLVEQGLVVLDRNWRSTGGEIDIVARDGDVIVVCEVKTRTSNRFGSPFEAITRDKASRLHRLGFAWLRANGVHCAAVRVDVVAIIRPVRGRTQVQHMQGVA